VSSLIGNPGEACTLSRAVDALTDAARQVGRPGLVWLTGAAYPSLDVIAVIGGPVLVALLFNPGEGPTGDVLATAAMTLLAVAILMPRLSAGLASLAGPEQWATASGERGKPSFLQVWRAGRGLGWATLGLWLHILAMLIVPAIVTLAAPLAVLKSLSVDPGHSGDEVTVLWAMVLSPFVSVVVLLGLVLSVVHKLALQSLVYNQRGVNSALLHAWRLVRANPWAAVRACLVDFLAFWVVAAVQVLAVPIAAVYSCCFFLPLSWLVLLLYFANYKREWMRTSGRVFFGLCLLFVPGVVGILRAAYWARVYRSLGGLAPADSVPGLSSKIAAARDALEAGRLRLGGES